MPVTPGHLHLSHRIGKEFFEPYPFFNEEGIDAIKIRIIETSQQTILLKTGSVGQGIHPSAINQFLIANIFWLMVIITTDQLSPGIKNIHSGFCRHDIITQFVFADIEHIIGPEKNDGIAGYDKLLMLAVLRIKCESAGTCCPDDLMTVHGM